MCSRVVHDRLTLLGNRRHLLALPLQLREELRTRDRRRQRVHDREVDAGHLDVAQVERDLAIVPCGSDALCPEGSRHQPVGMDVRRLDRRHDRTLQLQNCLLVGLQRHARVAIHGLQRRLQRGNQRLVTRGFQEKRDEQTGCDVEER